MARRMVSVFEAFCEPFPGYYLFYPYRWHVSPAQRAFIEYLRQWRVSGHLIALLETALERSRVGLVLARLTDSAS